MRVFGSLAAILCITACNGEAGPSASDGPSAGDPGTYTRMMPDGLLNTTVIGEDGSYLTTIGKESRSGSVRSEGDQTCFTGDNEDAVETCWTNGPIRPGGTFESTNPAGETFTITYSPEVPAQGAQQEEVTE